MCYGEFFRLLKRCADTTIGVEPSCIFREHTKRDRGTDFSYAYAKDAVSEWGNRVDIITSFDVIEHVDNLQEYMDEVYALLKKRGGQ